MGAYEFGDEMSVQIIPDNDIVCSGSSTSFMVNYINVNTNNITEQIWNFGDGEELSTNDLPVYHTYNNPTTIDKPYAVTLTVELNNGIVLTDEHEITVKPEIVLNASPGVIREGDLVYFSSRTDIPILGWQLYYYDENDEYVHIASGGPVSSGTVVDMEHQFLSAGEFDVYLTYDYEYLEEEYLSCTGLTTIKVCSGDCIIPFSPQPGNDYILSIWASEDQEVTPITYENSAVRLGFLLTDETTLYLDYFKPSGPIIDGWQKIEEVFTIPEDAIDITVELVSLADRVPSYFDDIRISPFNSTMKTYVYDPETLRFVAELDENNFATYYEYDHEGKLTRTKKETERGIMTLQEARRSTHKHPIEN